MAETPVINGGDTDLWTSHNQMVLEPLEVNDPEVSFGDF